jgi:hypothetical protein
MEDAMRLYAKTIILIIIVLFVVPSVFAQGEKAGVAIRGDVL